MREDAPINLTRKGIKIIFSERKQAKGRKSYLQLKEKKQIDF